MAWRKSEHGSALVAVLVLLALLMTLLMTHFSLTWIELTTTRSSMGSFVGFYSAEAGLNIRADVVRSSFQGWNRPVGTSPDTSPGATPCDGGNDGSGDLRCVVYKFQERQIDTYLTETGASGTPIVIPRGETFQNLHAHEFHHVVYSRATNSRGRPEAVLEMHIKSRLVPLFQFAAFYDKDLELLTSGSLLFEGPVHANGDLYLGTVGSLDVTAPVTSGGAMYRGRKDADSCLAGPVRVSDPATLSELPTCSSDREQIEGVDVVGWNGMVLPGAEIVTAPEPDVLDPTSGHPYWDRADLRIVLDINTGTPAIQVRHTDGSVDNGESNKLNACGVVSRSSTLYNNREATGISMLEVDVQGLLDCLHVAHPLGVDLDDTSDGGLVWFLTVDGPDSDILNAYGVRLTHAVDLTSTILGAPAILGLTVATDQALYVQGSFNAVNTKPSALMADSFNLLSNAWSDANSTLALSSRPASATAVHAAILAGSDTTGGAEGPAGQDLGAFAGSLSDLIRMHEDWNGVKLTYRGSLVSLDNPRHVDGSWAVGDPWFRLPAVDFSFDTTFEDAALLPPLSPQFVYVKQELFVRQFEL